MNRRISLRIHYDRRSALVLLSALILLMMALTGVLAWGQREVAASNRQSPLPAFTGTRRYYLTNNAVQATQVLSACTIGYHTASLWEILDPSHLKYNTTLGATSDDSGQGPPSSLGGWVRTGYNSSNGITPGQANCYNWSSNSSSNYGTYAQLPSTWTAGSQDMHVWDVHVTPCSGSARVWCIEDYIIYLPVILRDSSL